ncbi:MAG: hypothetical protein GF329_07950 [Candidatus Lokiarchaeota archaeon]|nr:hypothetical protein [Candidatus Lokiarchaeota archaeon]
MKFLTDAMHGRIARYLRILGYDTFYPGDLDDSKILEIAEKEDRILITRDLELSQRAESKNIPIILLNSVNFIKNFHEIYKKFPIDLTLDPNKSRCPVCNSNISPIPKKQVLGKVPKKTYENFDEFLICNNPKCRKIYYNGLHWVKLQKKIDKIKNYKP